MAIEVFATRDRDKDVVDFWDAESGEPVQDEDGWWMNSDDSVFLHRVPEHMHASLGLVDLDTEKVHRVRIEVCR